MDFGTILQILDSTLRLATPLLFACLAGLYSERAGVFDIGLEGKMLMAAFAAGAVASVPVVTLAEFFRIPVTLGDWASGGNAWIGLLAGVIAAVLLSILHGLASITFRGNQIISGVAINFLAAGLTVLVGQNLFRQGGQTPPLSGDARFQSIELPFVEALDGVPFLGPVYRELISGHNILVYLAILAVPLTWWLLFRTRFGLRLRAVGENPGAVDTAGINVTRQRYLAVIVCGILCGFAGAYLSTAISSGFGNNMSAGRGFIALAALIFAKWRPVAAMWACLLFGFFQALALRKPAFDIGPIAIDFNLLPSQLLDAIPYILTVIVLAGFIGKAVPPKAGGAPYVKER